MLKFWWAILLILLLLIRTRYARVLLYETEENISVEHFDCVYYVANKETALYCRRPGVGTHSVKWYFDTCQNDGQKWYYDELQNRNITPSDILSWSSSIESADNYSGHYYNYTKCEGCFLCNCTKLGTFGKFCQYQLTHEAHSFEQAIDAQFRQKASDPWGIQRFGNITCYTTLTCNSDSLCLDWREICDGQQQCMFGLDEENCDLLEFNECEDDQFRCNSGMCIAEEYWLDGYYQPLDIINHREYLG